MGFEVEANKLIDKFDELRAMDLTRALNEACLLVEDDAKRRAPVRSGELRRSITSQVKDEQGFVGTNLHYAPYVEYGTGLFSSLGNGRKDVPWAYKDAKGDWHSTYGNHPQPFLHPAFENNKQEIIEIFRKYLKEAVEE